MSNSFYCSLKYQEFKQKNDKIDSEKENIDDEKSNHQKHIQSIHSNQHPKKNHFSSLLKWFGSLS